MNSEGLDEPDDIGLEGTALDEALEPVGGRLHCDGIVDHPGGREGTGSGMSVVRNTYHGSTSTLRAMSS